MKSPIQRAMAKNRTGNLLERRFRMLLVSRGIRHQVQPRAPMSPDFHLPDLGLDVFLDGCFWHYCPQHWRRPRTNTAHWNRKRARNSFHEYQRSRLRRRWVRIWEHELPLLLKSENLLETIRCLSAADASKGGTTEAHGPERSNARTARPQAPSPGASRSSPATSV